MIAGQPGARRRITATATATVTALVTSAAPLAAAVPANRQESGGRC
jgi:hypothetical protein